jgi:hypothetical protein
MQIQPFRGWPILLRILCAKGGCQIPNLKPSKQPRTREEQGIQFCALKERPAPNSEPARVDTSPGQV